MSSPCTYAGRTGTKYTYAELEGLWLNAGGPKGRAALMAAIAEAESGGCSAAVNQSSGASGLWQILGAPGSWSGSTNWLDPATNAKAAVAKYHQQGLGAWSTYTSGAYRAFMKSSTSPNTNVPGSSSSGGGSGSSGAGSCSPNAVWCIPAIPFGPLGTIGPITVLTKSEVRAWAGLALMAVGGLGVLVFGSMLASAFGVNPGGALGRAAGGLTETVGAGVSLVAPEAGLPMVAAGHQVRQHGATKAAQQAAVRRARARQAAGAREDREAERRLGHPRENPSLRTGRGAVRESGAGTRERAAARRAASRRAESEAVPF